MKTKKATATTAVSKMISRFSMVAFLVEDDDKPQYGGAPKADEDGF